MSFLTSKEGAVLESEAPRRYVGSAETSSLARDRTEEEVGKVW